MLLFLEGPSGSGKSTLLRECLKPYSDRIGGFSSQRLWKEGYASYRIVPASIFQLDAEYHSDMDHIFKYHYKDVTIKSPDVFKQYGVSLLERSSGYPLILLDEIGGAELLVPAFKEKLYEVLRGPVPCIGVLKLPEKVRFMKNEAAYDDAVVTFNDELREYMQSIPDSQLISFDGNNEAAVKRDILIFLERCFSLSS